MKRKDECLFCTSRCCYTRIHNETYDEIACSKHIKELEKHSDNKLGINNGIMREHLSSTCKLQRGR